MTSLAEVERTPSHRWTSAPTGGGRTVVRVALAGCGSVGSALIRELVARREALADRHGVEIVISSVLVRDVERPREATFDRALLTDDLEHFLAAEADVVIEAIGGIDPALRIAESALRGRRRFVTANKALLAQHGSALAALARQHDTALRYDAAVGGGVPILRLLDDALGAGIPVRVRGILNGTTNYVLTRLERGLAFTEALREARVAGFAEADASRDLDGRDAADKLALVAWAAFGVAPEELIVRRTSLLPDPARYTSLAERCGRSVRQVAECAIVHGVLVASVEPLLVAPGSALARTRDEQNRVDVHTGWTAPLCASGPGAGGLPTATALLSDLVSTSGAPRRRGRISASGDDARRCSWAVEIIGASCVLHRTVSRCGFVQTDVTATKAWTVVTDATREEIATLLDVLTAAGVDPVAARFDDADEELQTVGLVA